MFAVTPLWFRRNARKNTRVTGSGNHEKLLAVSLYGDGGLDQKTVVAPRLRCDGGIRLERTVNLLRH